MMKKQSLRRIARFAGEVAGLTLIGAGVALASSGGPFSAIFNFIDQNFLPALGAIGVIGGVGYGAIHAFKHDYGKAVVGLGVATGGGFVVKQSNWFSGQAGVSAATIGHHLTTVEPIVRALGL
ncbi:hypothetical protein [Acidithiobacillus caldus]|jgi:hypothetical protein|uniref:hypothetical protein n=1 Tax=Acidithiobacillus caldus TaxID=33059 RepID=UPI0007D8F1F9|nr:hypothetical protein [Acidithiobacillus caldus]QER46008.1 hypothetical protein F0726_02962 [Acidithiobacillus caldus]